LRVRPLTTGVVRQKAGARGIRRYLVDRWRDETIPVHAFLIDHPAGPVLFDAGQTARAAAPGWFPRWHPFFKLSRFELAPGDEVSAQLRGLGIEPAAVKRVILSHLHTDHVGGLDDFRGAEVLVPRVEWRQATGWQGRLRGYLPQRWPAGLEPTLVDFADGPVGPFAASHDVAGDGTLLLVPTPGHTAGHAALLVRDGGDRWLLAGDLGPTPAEISTTHPDVAAWCRAEGVVILTAHDDRAAALVGASA
jgi:N-acyl homoserine lactone hydrolase